MADITIPTDDGEVSIVVIDADEANGQAVIGEDGVSRQETPDGGIIIDLAPEADEPDEKPLAFYDNLLPKISASTLATIADNLLRAIEADEQSRQGWLDNRAEGLDLLAFKLEKPKDAGPSAGGGQGMSTVRHPILQEAVIRFQSNASAELLPTSGPVKVRDDTPPKPPAAQMAGLAAATGIQLPPPGIGDNGGPPLDEPDSNLLAEALEKDLNHYLTVVDRGYRSDTDRMLFWVGYGGCAFKKVYHCPIRRMPISRSVDAKDLIVNHAANSIEDCGRITHRIMMRRSELARMKIAGVYVLPPSLLSQNATPTPNQYDDKMKEAQGFTSTSSSSPEDQPYEILECYCELNIPGLEHELDGEPSGLDLPYRVTIERETKTIIEVRRNWREDDEQCIAKQVFVKFPFVPADGFYEIGLLNILGNGTKALTAAWRIMLDSGMFASFPGFLYGTQAGRQQTNNFMVPPGGGVKIETGGQNIQNVVMPLPYKSVDQGFVAFMAAIEATLQRVGGTAELMVGEGKQDAPVGTTLALIEQATKMLAAVHIRLHAAQSEEFQLLKERLKEDPKAFFDALKKRASHAWEAAEFLDALETCDLVPAADPNTPSHMHRIMKAVSIKQLQGASPGLYDPKKVDSRILSMIGVSDPESLFAPAPPAGAQPPGPPQVPMDPNKMAQIQAKDRQLQQQGAEAQQELATKGQIAKSQDTARQMEVNQESQDRDADRKSRENIAAARERTEAIRTAGQLVEKGIDPSDVLEGAVKVLAPAGSDASAPAGVSPLGGAQQQPQAGAGGGQAQPGPFGGPLPEATPNGALARPPQGWTRPI
jgi:hypothetical protein